MSRLSETALCRYEPRLLSRSTTTLNPSSKTCCSIVSRTFDGDIAFCFSLFVARLRDEAASVSTGGILIVEISRSEMVGQPRQSYFNCIVDERRTMATLREATGASAVEPSRASSVHLHDDRTGSH